MTDIYAIIRIRGSVNARKEIEDTMEMLKLKKVNNCIIYPKTPDVEGMLKKARSYITWGEVTEESLVKLLLKRAKLQGDKELDEKIAKEAAQKIMKEKSLKNIGIKIPLRLSQPSKGYSSVKQAYPRGDYGYRKEKINELIEKMI